MLKLTTVAALAMVAGLVSGCGGGAPTDASEKDFCSAFTDFATSVAGSDEDADTKEQIKKVKAAVKALEDAGTPESISEDGRKGFELFTGLVSDLDDDMTEDELDKIGDDLSDTDDKSLTAFEDYAQKTCASPTEGSN